MANQPSIDYLNLYSPQSTRIQSGNVEMTKNERTLPVVSVHGLDPRGKGIWNTTRCPCIILDRMPVKHITNTDWETMNEDQQRLVTTLALSRDDKMNKRQKKWPVSKGHGFARRYL
jgi:hypothetical protein